MNTFRAWFLGRQVATSSSEFPRSLPPSPIQPSCFKCSFLSTCPRLFPTPTWWPAIDLLYKDQIKPVPSTPLPSPAPLLGFPGKLSMVPGKTWVLLQSPDRGILPCLEPSLWESVPISHFWWSSDLYYQPCSFQTCCILCTRGSFTRYTCFSPPSVRASSALITCLPPILSDAESGTSESFIPRWPLFPKYYFIGHQSLPLQYRRKSSISLLITQECSDEYSGVRRQKVHNSVTWSWIIMFSLYFKIQPFGIGSSLG